MRVACQGTMSFKYVDFKDRNEEGIKRTTEENLIA